MEKVKKRIKEKLLKLKGWVSNNRTETIILLIILIVGAFMRLYRIDQYMTFLGDEGRDVIVVRRLLVDFDPILVGPGTSIGDMYLGPLYYYMMAPFLLLFGFNPVGPAVMVALLGVVTIFFVWFVARKWFGKVAAQVASFLYAIAPVVIVYSRSSWNPNIMPFFALLTIYGMWKIWQEHSWKWLMVVAISYAFVLQSHYLGLLLAPVAGLFWILTFKKVKKTKQSKNFIRISIYSAILFSVLMSPLVIFDARHGWRNFSAMQKFFVERQTTVSAKPWNAIPNLPKIVGKIIDRLILGGRGASIKLVMGAVGVLILTLISKLKKLSLKEKSAYFLIFVWLATAFIGFGVYKQEIYDHYYGLFFVAPFLLLGGLVENATKNSRLITKLFVAWFLAFLLFANLSQNPLKYFPNNQLGRTKEVSEKIINESNSEKYNIAVIAERNYEGAYQYFLEKEGSKIVIIDPQRADETIAEQLFVVCELEDREKCDPTHNPKTEVANFGWSEIVETWEVAGVALYKLVHSN